MSHLSSLVEAHNFTPLAKVLQCFADWADVGLTLPALPSFQLMMLVQNDVLKLLSNLLTEITTTWQCLAWVYLSILYMI